jgi:hypothetical protein
LKILLLLSLITLLISPTFAATAVKLSCSIRNNVTVSQFKYQLSTMKWDNRFQIASGVKHARTKNNIPYAVTRFRNGDKLVVFEDSQQYFLVYANSDTPDRCELIESYDYDVTELPRFHKLSSASQ